MSELDLTNIAAGSISTPAAGVTAYYTDSTSKLPSQKNDAGVIWTASMIVRNQSVAAQGAGFASDTYLIGSNCLIPSGYPHVGSVYTCTFDVAKTAAGIATPIITLRIGTAGTTGDAAITVFTFTAGTAAIDVGTISVLANFRTVGSGTAAVLQGRATITHGTSATTGLVNLVAPTLQVTSSGFNSTIANSIIGLSVNGGASAAWTVQLVTAEFNSF